MSTEKTYKEQYDETKVEPLVKPCPPEGDYEGQIAYYKRKLSYKMPVTFRYGATIGLGTGFVYGIYKKSISVMVKHTLVGAAICGLGLCYHEFYELSRNYYLLNNKK